MDYNALAELLFPNIKNTPDYYEKLYKPRDLKDGEVVTRFAPSPTGFIHMGSLYMSFIDRTFTNQFGGIFYLRIEDTDQKREIENGVQIIKDAFDYFGIKIDESSFTSGDYGPYKQSERAEIYQTYVKDLVRKGLAYPCFCTEGDLEETRNRQTQSKIKIGYYGDYAVCRNLSLEDIKNKIDNKEPYVLRLKTPMVKEDAKIECVDLIKGTMYLPVNDIDIVLLKSDGIPTYHFAHAVDDHLMRTTHVIRGDEWLSSLPIHLQLFSMLGFNPPKFAHIAPLTKKDGEVCVRKLSKRKDPECAMSYYQELGIPVEGLKLYFATITNSNFEQWYEQNKDKDIKDFTFSFDKMPVGGTLFDVDKLMSICKIYLSKKTNVELFNDAIEYNKQYDKEFYEILKKDKAYTLQVLNIERNVPRPRMDIGCYQDIKMENAYMFDELFSPLYEKKVYDYNIIDEYIKVLDLSLNKDEWFNSVKELAVKLNYAPDMKSYKLNPENYKGNVADICETIRIALTGKNQSPNLYDIQQVLGIDRIKQRFSKFKENSCK